MRFHANITEMIGRTPLTLTLFWTLIGGVALLRVWSVLRPKTL